MTYTTYMYARWLHIAWRSAGNRGAAQLPTANRQLVTANPFTHIEVLQRGLTGKLARQGQSRRSLR